MGVPWLCLGKKFFISILTNLWEAFLFNPPNRFKSHLCPGYSSRSNFCIPIPIRSESDDSFNWLREYQSSSESKWFLTENSCKYSRRQVIATGSAFDDTIKLLNKCQKPEGSKIQGLQLYSGYSPKTMAAMDEL